MNSFLHAILIVTLIWGSTMLYAKGGSILLWLPMSFAGGWMIGKVTAKATSYDLLMKEKRSKNGEGNE